MTHDSDDVFAASYSLPLPWPAGWPEGVGVLFVKSEDKVEIFHEDEPWGDVFDRAGVEVPEGSPRLPDQDEMGVLSSRLAADQDRIDEACDFLLNYEYAKSEGLPVEIPASPQKAPRNSPAISEDLPSLADSWKAAVPVAGARLIEGAKVRRSVSGDVAIDIPLFGGVEEVELQDIYAAPGAPGLFFRNPGWDGVPGTVLLPGEVFRLLGAPEGGFVRMIKTKGWFSVFPEAAVAAPHGESPEEALDKISREGSDPALSGARKKKKPRGKGSIYAFAIMIMIAFTAYSIWSDRNPAESDPISEMRRQTFQP